MENGPQDASGRFLKQLWRQLCAQDQVGLEALLTPDVQINLVLPGRRWKAHGGANAAKKLLLLLKSSRIRPVLSSYYMERPFLAQGIFQMVGDISVLKDGFPYEICFAATVVESQGSWKLLFLFGEIQARQEACKQSNELKKMLMKKTIALEKANQELGVLAANLPGGVITVYADDCFTLKYANQGYFKLLGYTRKQMAQELKNKTLRLVAGPMQSKVENSVRRQLAEGETVEEELCLLRRDGTEIWAMQRGRLMADEAGRQVICCMVVDITQSKKAREALAISEERYRVVSEQGRDVVFEYDIKTGQVYISGQFEKKFGYPPLLKERKNTAKIHQQDKDAFLYFADQIRNGKRPQDIKVRIWSAQDTYVWCRLEAAVIYDGEGRPARAIGRISDIDQMVQEADRLKAQARCDPLTNLANKAAAEKEIEKYLKSRPQMPCALFVVDIDDFKGINDSQGHRCGDEVLRHISRAILSLFRKTDIVGRIGGDEFLVLMKDVTGAVALQKKADALLSVLSACTREDGSKLSVSASVGISVYPRDGIAFPVLFDHADQALYEAKSKGKNACRIYCRSAKDAAMHKK